MSPPSLSPNRDAVLAAGRPESVTRMMAAPGRAGVLARVVAAVTEAVAVAVASEIDRRSDPQDICMGVVQAIGNVFASTAHGFGDPPHEMLDWMVASSTAHAVKAIAKAEDGQAVAVRIPHHEVGRA